MKKFRLKHLKVFGLLFSMAVMCIAVFIPTETVQAKNIKNKTFVIKSDYPVTLGIQSLADNDKGGTDIKYYWPSGLGSITWSGYDWNTHSYTVTMKDVDVTKWTPYLEISADPTQSHYPKSITPTRWGGNGMNHGTTEVHNLQDISGYPNYRFMYIGLGYTADEIQVAFGEYRWYATYDLNGGQGDSSTQSVLRGSNITTHGTPTRHGYTFTHYHYSYNNSQYDVNANSALGVGDWNTANVTGPTINLVAQWSPNPYTISYNSNKPSKASSSVTGSTGQTDLVYDQTGNLAYNGFSITGWSFVNWNTKADGSGTTYQAGQQIQNMNDGQNTTLYAQWRPNVYTLILDDQYAVKSGTTLAFEKYDYDWYKESNAKTSLNNKVSVPSKTGQIFGGYYTGKEGNGEQWIDENGKIKIKANKISSEKTVYAKWTPAVYKITLDNQGANKGEEGTGAVWEKYNIGFYSDVATTKQYTDSNKKIICPKKKNYTFGGYWTVKNDYNQSNGQQLVDGNGEINIAANTLFEKDSTVYAKWLPNTYKINLDNQGADIDKGTSAYYEKYGILNYTSLAEYDVNTGIATLKYDYTGNTQTFTAPADGDYTLEVAGAQGGDHPSTSKENATSVGGQGGTSKGTIHLKAGETLYIEVGNKPYGYNGSYNGSDSGWIGIGANGTYVGGSLIAGGGATDIRRGGKGIDKRVIVAGGGGGATYYNGKAVNGAAGGGAETGTVAYITALPYNYNIYTTVNKGANQTGHFNFTRYEQFSSNMGGGCLSNPYSGSPYGFICYLEAETQNKGFYNGGGGYWGGAFMHGNCVMAGGLGGSGYIGGVTDGSMQTGVNEGNGYAKITYIDTDISDSSACSIRIPKKSGYTFDGYWTEKNQAGEEVVDATGAVCSSVTRFNDDNTDSNHQTTVYAHWTDNEYSVIYKSNYTNPKTGKMIESPDYQYRDYVRYNRPYRVKDNMFNVPSGYKFKEWNTKQDGTGKKWKVYKTYEDEILYNNAYSTTLYAIWEPDNNHYTVNRYIEKLDSDYEKPEDRYEKYDSKVISENVKTGSEIKVTAEDIEGFTFDKTQTKSDDIIGTDNNGYSTIRVKADGSTCINYYYTRNAYKLTLRKGNGITKVYGAGEEESAMIKYQDDVVIDADLDVDNGYSWSNWTNTSDNAVISKEQSYSFKMPAKNLDYTANANQDQKFTLTVIPLAKNDSSETSQTATWYDPVSQTVKTFNKGVKITFILNYNNTLAIANPDRTSFNYEGWKIYESDTYDAETNTGTEIVPGKGNSYVDSNGIFHMGNKNTTIVAQWNVISAKYQVNYWFQKANGNPDGKLADNYNKDIAWSYTAYADADSKISPKVYTLMDCAKETSNTAEEKTVNDLKEKLYGFYAPDMETETVKADGTTVINYKYTRSKIDLKYNAGSDPNGNKASVKASGYKTDANGNIQKSNGTDVTTTLTYGATNLKTADANTFNLSLTGYSLDKRQTWVNKILGLYLSGNQKMMPSEIMAVQSVIDKKFESETTRYINTLDSKIIADKNWTKSYWNGLNYAERNRCREEYMTNTANNKLAAQTMNSELQNMIKNSPVLLSANWEANSYDVTLNYNGATTKPTSGSPMGAASTIAADGNSATWNSYVQYDHVIPKVFGSDKIAKTGYTFTGWKNGDVLWNADGAVVKGRKLNNSTWSDAQGLYKYTGNTTVTAQWSENSYNIEFKANKPSKASNNVSGDLSTITNVKYTQSVTLKCAPSLTGWTFKGWNTQADGKGTSYSAGQSVSKLSATNGATVTLYAQWEATTYTITFNSNKPSKAVTQMTGTMEVQTLTYDKWENLHENKYKLEGWTFDKWNLKADGSSETSYKNKERVRNICDGKDTTLYAQWKDTTPPDSSKTYLRATKSGNVNDPDYARALAVVTKGSKDVTTSTSVTRTLDGLGNSTWTTSWINSDVSLDLYSYDNGTGIKLLTTYSGNNEWNKTKFTPSDSTKQVKSSKYDTSEGIEVFHGIATDDSNNSTATRNLTVKIDKTAPTGSFMVKTGTLKNPLAGTTSMIYDSNGMVTGVNPEGMRTEIIATISDNGNESSVSGVKHVWAVVTDMENANISKSYKCNRISGDKYNGIYIAVDESGNKPNLYEDFSTSRKLKIKVYACDEAGNISVYKDKEPNNDPNKPTSVTPPSSDPENNIVTNISMWSQIIRDDKEVPDTSYAIGKDGKDKDGHSAEGPAFLLNQSGKVHIVTYGYVEAVDVNFPPALQAAAQTDVAKGQTVKNLGTIANVNGAYVDNRLALSGGCARITDYPFIVPLYLDDTSVKTYKTNGDKWLDGITNGIKIPAYIPTANTYMPKKADGTYDIKTVDTVEIPYKGSRTVSGTAVPIEPYNKNECDLRTTASFYCAKDYASKQIISITDKLHTHLVN